jgi:MFS family permease
MFKHINKNTFQILWPFFIYKIFKGGLFITSITFFIFFQEKGIDYAKTSILLSLIFLLPVFFEIPTGIFADAFGRKISVLIGYFGEILVIAGIILNNDYTILFILFILWGIVMAFSSGADDAWAIELLPEDNKENIIDAYYSISASCYSIGMIFAGLLSTIGITMYGQSSVWVIDLVILVLILLVFIFTKENYTKDTAEETSIKEFYTTTKKGFYVFRDNKNIQNILLGEIFVSLALVGVGNVISQKYLMQSGFAEQYWGITYSAVSFIAVLIPAFAIQVAKKFSHQKKYLMTVMFLQWFLFFIASLIFNPIFAVIFIFLHNSLEEAFNPINIAFFQKEIPSSIRATIGSLRSMTMSLSATFGIFLAGILVEYVNVRCAMMVVSSFLFLALFFYNKIKITNFLQK